MPFQPLAIAAMMKLAGRGADSLNWMVYLSGAAISLTALNRMLRGMLMPSGGLAMRSNVAFTSSEVSSAPSWNMYALAQKERIGLAVLGDLPAMREVRNDGLAAVARIVPDQVVEHAALGADVADGAGLLEVEMRRPVEDADAEHAAVLRIRLRRGELEFRAVEFVGNVRQCVGRVAAHTPPAIAAALP